MTSQKRRRRRFVSLLVLVSLFVFSNAFAQIQLVDQTSGEVLPNVIVKFKNQQISISNTHGRVDVDLSLYSSLSFIHAGYRDKTQHIENNGHLQIISLLPIPKLLSEVVVSTTRSSSSQKKNIGMVHIISPLNTPELSDITTSQALKSTAGLQVQEGAYNTSRITMRGMGARNPYASNRIKAYFGDIPLTDGEGSTSLEDISYSSIGRIEVLKGTTSALYGSGLGGVIRLFPLYPTSNGVQLKLNQSLGSFGLYNTDGTFFYKKNNWALVSSISHTDVAGYRDNNKFKRTTAMVSANYFGTKHRIHVLANYSDVLAQIPSSLNLETFDQAPSSAASNWLNVKGFESRKKFLTGINLKSNLTNALSNSLSINGNKTEHYESRPFNILEAESTSYGIRDQLTYTTSKLRLIAGIDAQWQDYHWNIYQTNEGVQAALTNQNNELRQQLDATLISSYEISPGLILEAGLGLSQFSYKLEDLDNNSELDLSGNYTPASILSPRLGFNYAMSSNIHAFGLFSQGFSAPSVEESLLPAGAINTNLKPEKGTTFEIGTSGTLFQNRLSFSAALYTMRVSNLLVTKRVSEDAFVGVNAGKTKHTGLELNSIWTILSRENSQTLSIETSYTYSRNMFVDFIDNAIAYDGKKLPGIPEHLLNIYLRYSPFSEWKTSFWMNHASKQYLNDSNASSYSGYTIFNLQTHYEIALKNEHSITLFASAKNLFNVHYASMILPNARAFGNASPRYYYPALPRNFIIGLKLQF